jgi:hypothetical protein
LRWGTVNFFFCWAGLKLWSSQSSAPYNWDYRHKVTGSSQYVLFIFLLFFFCGIGVWTQSLQSKRSTAWAHLLSVLIIIIFKKVVPTFKNVSAGNLSK